MMAIHTIIIVAMQSRDMCDLFENYIKVQDKIQNYADLYKTLTKRYNIIKSFY